ncbi:cyclodeaminase/cyclohydrolase family protein [Desulforamulus hydrothermalis]|uniref:Formiminotransferase-cyclodeaminase n=1 Tax=Desulforamulus hydrothermalis Lam5 = DSM 18033 TaxID=1121428 RepID=K8EBB2_9FIRM|nr:cyclodeaminase/cyclohydrolase family protein [Desulforamulus hydrothermalis]CCO08923.1 Formiminotransferase-cyclodeaminase [Desulforamulus hydrothermalis Lam5 = DSM 18033]SHG74861.1 Formimidoyltetrahydrofolate cyclodeaminase [Desulforamulus hydrothermalis Lam5 = DSM 18033]
MMNYLQWSVEELFARTASPAPEPGGGGVAAMTGCLAAGLLNMVAGITAGKEKYRAFAGEIQSLISDLQQCTDRLKLLAQRDMEAFHMFMAALAMPKGTPAEKTLREEHKQQAALLCADVPLQVAQTCLDCLKAAHRLADVAAKTAVSDVGVAAHLLAASLKGALLMVDDNLGYINDLARVKALITEKEQLLSAAEELCASTLARVKGRMAE